MPKVHLTKQDEVTDKLVSLIYGTMKVKHIPQRQIADRLYITQPAFGKKLTKKQFTFWDLYTIFDELEFTDEQILSVMR